MQVKDLYVGAKVIKALPMTRAAYNDYRGWTVPDNECGEDAGFLVEYRDGGQSNHPDHEGYISWSPAEVFSNAYKASGELDFGAATKLAKEGCKVARKDWNESGMFAYVVPANKYPVRTEMVKGVFENDMVPYRAYWALKTAQNDVVPWTPSGTDTLSEDWTIVE